MTKSGQKSSFDKSISSYCCTLRGCAFALVFGFYYLSVTLEKTYSCVLLFSPRGDAAHLIGVLAPVPPLQLLLTKEPSPSDLLWRVHLLLWRTPGCSRGIKQSYSPPSRDFPAPVLSLLRRICFRTVFLKKQTKIPKKPQTNKQKHMRSTILNNIEIKEVTLINKTQNPALSHSKSSMDSYLVVLNNLMHFKISEFFIS